MQRHVFLAGTAAAAALATPLRARAAIPEAKLITSPFQSASNAYYADQRGFFKSSGVDVEVSSMTNGSAIISAIASGAADIGCSNPISVAVAVQRGLPLTIMAPSAFYSPKAPTSGLVVAQSSPIKTAHDLNGKTVAINGLMNIGQLAVMAWMDQNGGDSKSAHFIEMTFGDMIAGLGTGRIDAALLLEPALTESMKTGRMLAHAFDAIGSRFYLGVYFTTQDFAKKNADAVARIADGLAKASAWANANPKEADVILSKVSKIELPVVTAMTHSVYAGKLEAAPIQAPLDFAARYGALTHPVAAKDIMWAG
jgi:NitT/TauT family transport system substrate-binding protein